jgi:hypothetical protein
MYMRVTPLAYDPAQEETLLQIIDQQLLPVLRQFPGFVSYTGGLDRNTGRGITVTIWQDPDHAAGFRTALGSLVQQFEAVGVRFEPAEIYELIRQV